VGGEAARQGPAALLTSLPSSTAGLGVVAEQLLLASEASHPGSSSDVAQCQQHSYSGGAGVMLVQISLQLP
jgi:hypothetical protein